MGEFNWKEVLLGGWLYDHGDAEIEQARNRQSMNRQIKSALEVAFERISALEAVPNRDTEFLYAIAESHTADLTNRLAALEANQHNLRPFAMDMETMDNFGERLAALEAKPAPQPTDTVTVSKADWDATQEHIKYLVNALYDIHAAIETYARTLPGTSVGGARLIATMCKKAEDRQLEFEAEQGN